MSAVLPTDKTLVNRAGVDHSAPADMSTVQDTDLLLINRAGVDYKCTFADWKNSQSKPPNVDAVTLADVAGGARFTSVAFPVSATMTDDGTPTSTKKLKAYVEGALLITPKTSAITNVADHTLALANKWTSVGDIHPIGSSGPFNSGHGYVWRPLGTKTKMTWDAQSKPGYPQALSGKGRIQIAWSGAANNYAGTEFVFTNSVDGTTYRCPWANASNSPSSIELADLFTGPYSFNAFELVKITGTGTTCGGFAGIYIDGVKLVEGQTIKTLTLTDDTDLDNFRGGDVVQTGVSVASIDKAVPSISVDGGSWSGTDGTSSGTLADREAFVTGPPRAGANVKLFCKLDAAGAVYDLQSVDPGFTPWTPAGTGPYTGTVTFPATLPTGNAPDADLPAGTTITVEVEASNTAGTESAKTNVRPPA